MNSLFCVTKKSRSHRTFRTFIKKAMSSEALDALYDEADKNERIQEIIAFIFSVIFLVIYITFFYYLRKHEKATNKSKKTAVVTNIWILVFPIIYVLCYTIRYLMEIIAQQSDTINISLKFTMDLFYVIGNCVFYIIMILRLKLGFKGTEYELTKCKLIFCAILLFINAFINTFYFLIKREGITELGDNVFGDLKQDDIHSHLFIVLVCINLCLASVLIFLFVRNIVSMITFQMEFSEQNTLSQIHLNWLSIAIKYALLCGMAIIFTNIQFSGWILFNFGVFDSKPFGAVYFSMTNEWLWNIVLITNYLCIFLTFPMTAKLIYDNLCKSCHLSCQSLIKCCIIKYVGKKVENECKKHVELTTKISDENKRQIERDIRQQTVRQNKNTVMIAMDINEDGK
eukprot:530123_1